MILLDTDTTSLFLRSSKQYTELYRRIRETPLDDLYISAITVGEVMEGGLALVRRLQPKDQEAAGYKLLLDHFHALNRFAILPYDPEAEMLFQEMPARIRRQGRRDCQIAAIALTQDATLITRNIRHFSEVPGLRFEDWTQ
ncbi:type II toxin-antitoxin system VapC family toxin [Armatimonas sp.]|uniref:type II toxin-antitoxin system VapC family toxin n=1 Tax=Armatimonas sp. TaxID=1872638 RepID=UPI00286A834B|nr:type II toxin-antitoxin system VapC family toxin [Armatimonas sp.]